MINYQDKLNSLKKEEENLLKEITKKGGVVEDGKVIFSDKVYVVEILGYERSKYESYGYVELHHNLVLVEESIICKIKELLKENNKEDLKEFLFAEILDKYGDYLGSTFDYLPEEKIDVITKEDKIYYQDGFLVEYNTYNNLNTDDLYFCFFETSLDKFKKFENINIKFNKIIRIN